MPVPEIPTMYPPLAHLVLRATWRMLPDPVGFKPAFLLANLGVAALLAGWIRSTGGRNYQVAIHAWNPLVGVEFASSGHNDALAIAGVVATLLIIRRDPAMSTLTRTAVAVAKAWPAVHLPMAIFRACCPGKLKIASQQRDEFFGCHSCLAKDGAECSTIKRFMIGDHNLRERFVAPKDHMTSILTLELKSAFQKCGNALATRTCGRLVIQP
jgi:hypothetical protein